MKFWKEGKDCCSWDGVTCDMKTGQVVGLNLSYSWLQGPLHSNSSLFKLHQLQKVNLAYNNFSFSKIPSEFAVLSPDLPSTLGNLAKLVSLLLAYAQFRGEVPSSLGNLTQLKYFDISHNNLSITNLNTISELPKFQSLGLGSCNLSEFPSFLKTQDQLKDLDLSSNRIEGQIPKWFWDIANKKLEMLDLSHNKLQGSLDASPLFTSFFEISENKKTSLKVLDISKNQFSGTIPNATYGNENTLIYMEDRYPFAYNLASMIVINKGVEMELDRILKTLTSIDLSNNRFDGEIPSSIGNLQALVVLNLSSNSFSGSVPPSLGNMSELESLDLSKNKLSGRIPQQLANLTFLEYLNLSQNQLTGPIPQGKQLDTFSSSSFAGNPGLCGSPLSRNCENVDSPVVHHDKEVESEDGFTWKPVAVGYGFGIVVGFIIGHIILYQRRPNWFWKFCGKIYLSLHLDELVPIHWNKVEDFEGISSSVLVDYLCFL
ncbi:hypothetical protein FNV43_RR01635 [Rhamnella rubrinervis]|uniref:Receptor-like protein 12 n=1 Tax=Rhamnella rubrinervis TaxID=2594499 RepID=A0A8K0HRV3_9ROSA|nr:hypothetical protein FNV43_RR01635 [Rhamnella rubrinervis]